MSLFGGFDPHKIGTPFIADALSNGGLRKRWCEGLPSEYKDRFFELLGSSVDLFRCFNDINYYAPKVSLAFAVAGLDYVRERVEREKGNEISSHWREILTLARQDPRYAHLHRAELDDIFPRDLTIKPQSLSYRRRRENLDLTFI